MAGVAGVRADVYCSFRSVRVVGRRGQACSVKEWRPRVGRCAVLVLVRCGRGGAANVSSLGKAGSELWGFKHSEGRIRFAQGTEALRSGVVMANVNVARSGRNSWRLDLSKATGPGLPSMLDI